MAKFELTKTIEARKLNPRTKVPLNEWQTIRFGAIIENLADQDEVTQFSHLGEYYEYPRGDLKAASQPILPPA